MLSVSRFAAQNDSHSEINAEIAELPSALTAENPLAKTPKSR
jgi:hypothetical protein